MTPNKMGTRTTRITVNESGMFSRPFFMAFSSRYLSPSFFPVSCLVSRNNAFTCLYEIAFLDHYPDAVRQDQQHLAAQYDLPKALPFFEPFSLSGKTNNTPG